MKNAIYITNDLAVEKYGIATIAETAEGVKVKIGYDIYNHRSLIIWAEDNSDPIFLGWVSLETLAVDLSESDWGDFMLSDEEIADAVAEEFAKYNF